MTFTQRLLPWLGVMMFPISAAGDTVAGFTCRLRINQELEKAIVQANDLLAAGNADGARRSLNKIDTRYGGLAAPRSVDLAARIDAMN